MNLLIIEDDPDTFRMYETVINHRNQEGEAQITYRRCSNYQEAHDALFDPKFDFVILDLRLSGNTDVLEGLGLIGFVIERVRIPLVVYSGSLSQIDDMNETALFLKREREIPFGEILVELAQIYETGITESMKPGGIFESAVTKIFWNQMAMSLNSWKSPSNPKALLRHYVTLLEEYLAIDSEGNLDAFHPAEVFITPPIKHAIHTGDVVKWEEKFYVVLTPACDMVVRRGGSGTRGADYFLLVSAESLDGIPENKRANIRSNKEFRRHFLPITLISESGFLLDFQSLLSLPASSEGSIERIGTIADAFVKDLVSRFSAYYSRQGQPSYL